MPSVFQTLSGSKIHSSHLEIRPAVPLNRKQVDGKRGWQRPEKYADRHCCRSNTVPCATGLLRRERSFLFRKNPLRLLSWRKNQKSGLSYTNFFLVLYRFRERLSCCNLQFLELESWPNLKVSVLERKNHAPSCHASSIYHN